METAPVSPIYPMLITLLATGMRVSEACNLHWEDVDLDNPRIHIRSGKTSQSERQIPIDTDTADVLRSHRSTHRILVAARGEEWSDDLPAFPSTTNPLVAIHRVTPSAHLDKVAELAKIPRIRVHDLRHTHATLLLAAGIPVHVVSERLGHASPTITLDVYAHVLQGMRAEAAISLADIIGRDSATDLPQEDTVIDFRPRRAK